MMSSDSGNMSVSRSRCDDNKIIYTVNGAIHDVAVLYVTRSVYRRIYDGRMTK